MRRMLAPVTLMMILALLLACSSPHAVESKADLDNLFVKLRTTASADEAHSIELAIMHVWAHSGRPEVDAMMARGMEMVHTGDLDGALQAFDAVVRQAPTFAEGYNQRALVHAMRDEYLEAVEDIQRVLTIEPRHFGALAGLGRILLLYDRDEAALHAFEAALAINPHLDAVREQVDHLQEKLAGVPI